MKEEEKETNEETKQTNKVKFVLRHVNDLNDFVDDIDNVNDTVNTILLTNRMDPDDITKAFKAVTGDKAKLVLYLNGVIIPFHFSTLYEEVKYRLVVGKI